MKVLGFAAGIAAAVSLLSSSSAFAATEIAWWHAMGGELGQKLEEIVKADDRWDGRFFNLQVTDARPDSIEVRALVTARDAGTAFDLRCAVREAMLAFIRSEMPEALARGRSIVALAGQSASAPYDRDGADEIPLGRLAAGGRR